MGPVLLKKKSKSTAMYIAKCIVGMEGKQQERKLPEERITVVCLQNRHF